MAAKTDSTRRRSSYQFWRSTRVFVIQPIGRDGLSQGVFAFPQSNLKVTKVSGRSLIFSVDGMKESKTLKFEDSITASRVYQFILKCTFGGALNIDRNGEPVTQGWKPMPLHFATLPFVEPRDNTMVFDTHTGLLHIGPKSIRVRSLNAIPQFDVHVLSETRSVIVMTEPKGHECVGTVYAERGDENIECRQDQFERLCCVMNNYCREFREKLLLRNE